MLSLILVVVFVGFDFFEDRKLLFKSCRYGILFIFRLLLYLVFLFDEVFFVVLKLILGDWFELCIGRFCFFVFFMFRGGNRLVLFFWGF